MRVMLIVGALYFLLGLWCLFNPDGTSSSLGYQFSSDSGRNEYFTVYVGLDLGLGLGLIICALFPKLYLGGLAFGTVISALLVCFRLQALIFYPEVSTVIYSITVTEWIILAAFLVVCKDELFKPKIIADSEAPEKSEASEKEEKLNEAT